MNNKNVPKPLYLHNNLFFRNLKNSIHKEVPRDEFIDNSPDINILDKVKYKLNSYGYRSNDFIAKESVMILGCSQTFGYGLHEEFTWGTIFANKIKKTYARLAQPGDSAQAQVYKAFKYFEEFGNPEIIVASFPLTRIELPYIPKILEKKIKYDHEPQDFKIQQIMTGQENLLDFSKIPHNPDEILPKEIGIFYTFIFIQILEQYCKSNDIIFIWNIWEDHKTYTSYLKNNMPFVLKNHVDINFDHFVFDSLEGIEYFRDWNTGDTFIPECHPEFKNNKLYYRAADYIKDNNIGHWGIHINQHIAEAFYKKYCEVK